MTAGARLVIAARIWVHLLYCALHVPLAFLGALVLGGIAGGVPGVLLALGAAEVVGKDAVEWVAPLLATLGALAAAWFLFLDVRERGRHWRARLLQDLHARASEAASTGRRAEGALGSPLAVVTGDAPGDVGLERFADVPAKAPRNSVTAMFAVGFAVVVVAAISLPGFLVFGCRAKMAEARSTLKTIHVLQASRHGEGLAYGTLAELTTADPALEQLLARARYYEFTVTPRDDGFTAVARDSRRAVSNGNQDMWTIDQAGVQEHVLDGCSPR